MRSLLFSAIALALLAAPASADPLTPGMAADIDANLWPVARLMADDYMFDSVTFGGESSIFFEDNPLALVAEKIGNPMDENYEHRWLCYDAGDLRVYLLSDWRDHGKESTLELVTVEKVSSPDERCYDRPLAGTPQADGGERDIPGYGATIDDLLKRFGSAQIDANGRIAYRAVSIHGDEESWTVTKTVYYHLTDGKVDQVAFRRETRTNPYLGGWAVDNYRLRSPDAVDRQLPDRITGPFKVGTIEMAFGTAVLADVTNAFGGEIHSEGEAGSHMLWLCYLSDTPAGKLRTWFVSDGEMGGPEHRLTSVAVDPIDAEDEWSHGCIDAPANFALPAFDLPAIGATLAEVEAHFGIATPDARGNLYYTGNTPLGDGSAMIVYQSLSYRTGNGVVTGLAIDQEIVD